MNSKAVGEKTEGIILGHLMRLGKVVLLPFGNNQRYDLVVDAGENGFVRGQCKTGRYRKGCVCFSVSSVNGFTGKRTHYHNQADVFWVYCPELDTVYEVPCSEVGINEVNLRIDPPVGGAKSKIRWAKDFQI